MRLLLGMFLLQALATTLAFVAPSKTNLARSQSTLQSTLTSEDFIRLTKEYLADPSPDRLSEDYVFRGPVVGPLGKKVCQIG